MKRCLIVIMISLLSIQSAISEDSVHLNKNEPAPYDGYEIDYKHVVDIRNLSIDLTTQKELNNNLTQENTLMGERLKNAQDQNDRLSKEIVETKDSSFLGKAAFFIFGAVITGAVSYGVYKTR